jgi:hypothetical protein
LVISYHQTKTKSKVTGPYKFQANSALDDVYKGFYDLIQISSFSAKCELLKAAGPFLDENISSAKTKL